ncbi:hypothetical protein FOZ62_030722 [Perkinsus olseni]|uniref:Uncharacterized protein n=1 Tax=Perkinsus olseni TaxID=32597 RepID=A0A7J6PWI1_PEROL|nr:hypothetical protein FOZ62_030722 [Perkinsus olseni]
MSETPADNHNGEQEQQQENKDQDQPQSLQLKVKNAEGKEVMFKLKRGTPLRKVLLHLPLILDNEYVFS